MKNLKLSIKLLGREWRSGELRILVFALVTAVAATATIGFFTERLELAMARQSAELIGGDLVLRSSRPLDETWLQEGRDRDLEVGQYIEFGSVAVNGEAYILASIKAVDNAYPLLGKLRVSDTTYGEEYETGSGPAPGTVWADQRVLSRLGASVGETLEIGNGKFRVAQLLTYEPDRGGNLFNLAPRLLMHLSDVDALGVLTAGSRATYTFTYFGARAGEMKNWLEAKTGPQHRLLDLEADDSGGGMALSRAEQYLRLTSLLAVLLAAVAIVMATRRYSERHYDVSAMLRCLGASQQDILSIYLIQFLVISVVGGLLGVVLGWGAQWLLHELLIELLRTSLPSAGYMPALVAFATGILILAGTALPPILRLKGVPPLRVLRRTLAPLPVSAWIVYLAAWSTMALLLVLLAEDIVFTVAVFLGLGLIAGLLLLAVRGLFRFTRKRKSSDQGWLLKGLVRLARRSSTNAGQVIAFAVTITLMLVIGLLRTELLDNWAKQLPKDTPNHFAFNILPEDRDDMAQFLERKSTTDVPLYPMVRGRLVEVNGEPLRADPDSGRRGEGIGRELNLTWAADLPAANEIVAGQWWRLEDSGKALVSLEAEFAERIGAAVGDRITLDIVGSRLNAEVMSLRTLDWESFTPNFYIIFPPRGLEGFAATYITSFRLPSDDLQTLPELIRAFPATSVIEIDVLLEQLRSILRQVSLAVEIMLMFVLAAGFAVLFAAIQSSVDERIREGALMRVMGASRGYLRSANLTEFGLLGMMSGLLAVIGSELINLYMYARVFDIAREINWLVWPLVPLAAAVLIGLAGYAATRRAVTESPNVVLRRY